MYLYFLEAELFRILGDSYYNLYINTNNSNYIQSAQAAYNRAIKYPLNSNNPTVLHQISQTLYEAGDYETSLDINLRIMKDFTSYKRTSELMFLNGCLYKQLKKYTNSVECFQKILLHPPYNLTTATIWFIIATIFEESNSAQANAAYRRFYSTLVRDDKMDKYKDWNEARQDKDVWVKIGKTLHDLV